MGAMVVVARRLNVDIRPYVGIIVINVVIGFVFAGIDWRAHFGGLVTGALVGLLFAYAPVRGRVIVQVAGVLVILAVLAVGVVVRDNELTAQMLRLGIDSLA
jgi:hypothetical protein